MKTAGIVLKTVERCNIDCTYCYFFNSPNQLWRKHPKYISEPVLEQINLFIQKGCLKLDISHLTISFHGGEPLMQKKQDFANMCDFFRNKLDKLVKINLTIQTNGMLIDEEWMDLFKRYKVSVGISIDGPAEYHDKFRIDRQQRGTHSRVVKKINLLNQDDYFKNKLGVLCVINPDHSAEKIYRYFLNTLKIKYMDFILPDYNYQNPPPFSTGKLFVFLKELFDAWKNDDNVGIKIGLFDSLLSLLNGGDSKIYGIGIANENQVPIITIATNGDLSPTDEIAALDNAIGDSQASVFNTDWQNYMSHPVFNRLNHAQTILPAKCHNCHWQSICSGGGLVNRYHPGNGFDNPSIYCEDLQEIYATMAAHMLKCGYNLERLLDNVKIKM